MPTTAAMLTPAFVLAFWTFLVLIRVAVVRIGAAQCGEIVPDDFCHGESERVPRHVSIPNRNYMNLLELPVLFYVVSLTVVVTRIASPAMLGLAWAYVVLRLVHSLVHLTYNNVLHRLAVFAASNVVLLVLWLLAALALLG